MHQSIPAVPIPPPPRAIVGHFPALSIPGVGALAFHPITPGHVTISLLSPHNIIVSFNDHFIGKYGKFLLEYVWIGHKWDARAAMPYFYNIRP